MLISWLIALRWPMMIGLAVLGLFLVNRTFADMSVVGQVSELIRSYYPELTKPGWHELTSRIIIDPSGFDPGLISGLQSILGEGWIAKLPLIGFEGIIDPERILPAVIFDMVPTGMHGLVLVTILAASMSTFDSKLNLASSFVVRDIYQRYFKPKAGTQELIFVAWATTVSIATIGYIVGLNFGSINEIWDWIIMSLTTGLFVPGFLRLYWWRMNGWGVAFGMGAGGSAAILQRVFLPELVWGKFPLVALIALSATIIGCLLTKPTDRDTLVYFYKKTRPWGFWGPVKKWLTEEQRGYIDSENRRDLISLPFAFLYQVTLFMLPMQLIIHRFDAFFFTLPVFIISATWLYVVWWKNQRADRNMEEEPDMRNA